jgi:protein-S-isoprenylcysteine O-methyltransferase Ste14
MTDGSPSPNDRPGRVPWPPLLLVVLSAAAVALGYAVPLPWPGVDDAAARFIGWGFGLAGVALMTWAVITLRRHDTTVMPHQGARRLVTAGPYAVRRHPIYIADVLLFLFAAELTRNVWFVAAALAFVALVTVLQIRPEEAHLERTFGDAWRDYAARTRGWI